MLCSKEKRLSFQALLECQRFRGWIWPGIWNSAVWRERENTQMGEKINQDVLTLGKCKGREETGAEERNRRVSFSSRGAVPTAEDQRNWLHRMEKLIHDPWEKPAAAMRDILGPWPNPTEVSGVMNFSLELHPALLPLHLSLRSSCTFEDEGSLLLTDFVKSGVILSVIFPSLKEWVETHSTCKDGGREVFDQAARHLWGCPHKGQDSWTANFWDGVNYQKNTRAKEIAWEWSGHLNLTVCGINTNENKKPTANQQHLSWGATRVLWLLLGVTVMDSVLFCRWSWHAGQPEQGLGSTGESGQAEPCRVCLGCSGT